VVPRGRPRPLGIGGEVDESRFREVGFTCDTSAVDLRGLNGGSRGDVRWGAGDDAASGDAPRSSSPSDSTSST